jgi:hypothetical protein
MPGLIRGIARTAVAAGTFTAVSNRVSRHQYNKWAQEDAANAPPPQAVYYQGQAAAPPQAVYYQAPPPPPPPAPAPAPSGSDRLAQLKELASLKDQGILTEEEFAAEKAKILG